jgi:hypothetical protein
VPAKDRLHDTVIHALIKDGWTIVEEQYSLRLSSKRRLWIDIYAAKASERLAVLIEVKGFEDRASPIDYLADSAGKYVLYQTALEYLNRNIPLYLAVSEQGYNGILSEEVGQKIIQKLNMHLMVFNPQREEILQWIPKP